MVVFISYETTTGLSYAINLKKALEKVGISTFVANEDIQTGAPDREVIDGAIQDCEYFVAVLTIVAIWSDEVRREIELAGKLGKDIVPCKPYTVGRLFIKNLPIVGDLQQIDFESKEHLADQVVTEILKRKQQELVGRTPNEEAAETELANIQTAVIAMMVDNNLTSLPNPVTVATSDMNAFPDVSVCGTDKISDPKGNAYAHGFDKDGYLLFGHDITADTRSSTLVNYVASQYTKGTYACDASGTVTQVTTGYE